MEKVHSIIIGTSKIQYTLVRSSRKTVGITVTKDGQVKVAVPLKATEKQVKEIVQQKASWIIKKQEEVKKLYQGTEMKRQFTEGGRFFYLGNEFILRIHKVSVETAPKIVMENGSMIITLPETEVARESENIKYVLKAWYVNQFAEVIQERFKIYSPLIGVKPAKITIREQKTRWGSCSGKGSINLNWKLIMAPIEVLDYVIVHELCHMKEMNHSKKFWNLVKSVLPDCLERRKWLKMNGHRLFL